MIRLKSSYSADQLAVQWDKRTSPERFAGNDDFMDLCFAGFRKGNRIKLEDDGRQHMINVRI